MSKSEESTYFPGLPIAMKDGHLVIQFDVDLPLDLTYRGETGELFVECSSFGIEGVEKSGILRLRIVPEALRTLLRSLHEIEKTLGKELGAEPKRVVEQ